jgi:hypothetical protein
MKDKRLPRFKSLNRLVEFFEDHDLGEYLDEMPKARFDVTIKKRIRLIAIEAKLADQLTRIARSRRTSSQGLINAWLKQKVHEAQHLSE